MVTIFALLILGFITGLFIRNYPGTVRVFEVLTTLSIYALLFFLGLSIGSNEVLVKNFPKLGWHAIMLSAGGILGSIVLAKLFDTLISRKQ